MSKILKIISCPETSKCVEGMSRTQKSMAVDKIKLFGSIGVAIPFSLIRDYILKNVK